MKIFNLTVIGAMLLTLFGCGQGNNSNNNSGSGGSNVSVSKLPLTIDNAGTVPVFPGSATNSVVYVHNNTKFPISNISYSVKSNIEDSKNKFTIGNGCSTIPANSSCPLTFTTPTLDQHIEQGSALVTANFVVPNTSSDSFSQIINYALVSDTKEAGVLFGSGTHISGFGNDSGFATIYAYGSGSNQIYYVRNISSNKPGVKIMQGDITGTIIQSNFVQAIEISAPSMSGNSGFSATLTATSEPMTKVNKIKVTDKRFVSDINSTQNAYVSSSNVSINPVNTGAVLDIGFVPLILSSTLNPGGSVYIVNNGSSGANTISSTVNSGITLANMCSSSLMPGSSCTLNFSVPQSSGNGGVTVSYTGGANDSDSVTQSIAWFNNVGAPLLSMSSLPSSLSFNATTSQTAVITMTNIGGYDLSNVNVVQPSLQTNGSASSNVSSLNCTAGGNALPVGHSCSYSVTVSDNNINGELNQVYLLKVNANYVKESVTQGYSRFIVLPFNVYPYLPLLHFTASNTNWQIIGNNKESAVQTITMTNNGSAPALIDASQSGVTSTVSGAVVVSPNNFFSNCSSLAPGASCQLTATLGPVLTTNEETGALNLKAVYSSSHTDATTLMESFGFSILPQSALEVSSVNVNNASSGGTGMSSDTPYLFLGSVTSPQSVEFTLRNMSASDTIAINRVTDSNSLYAWTIDSSSTCKGGLLLNANDSCTLIYDWNLTTLSAAAANVGSTYTANLIVPSFTFRDTTSGLSFVQQPDLPSPYSGNVLYATGKQATIANQVSKASINAESFTITHVMANAQGYGPVTVKSKMEDYFGSNVPVLSDNCSQSTLDGIRTQTCTLQADANGVATGSGVYNVDHMLMSNMESISLNVLFSIETQANQTIYMNPLSYLIKFVQAPNYGTLSVFAGNGGSAMSPQEGTATDVPLPTELNSVASDKFGNTYIASGGNYILKVDASGNLSIFAGKGSSGQALMPATALNAKSVYIKPTGLAVDESGNVYFADYYSDVVAKVTPLGQLSIVAGISGSASTLPVAGPAKQTSIGFPTGIAIDKNNNLYITSSYRVALKVNSQGILSVIAGNLSGINGYPINGESAVGTRLGVLTGIAIDKNNNLYLADYGNRLVEKVDTQGIIYVIAGNRVSSDPSNLPIPGIAINSPLSPREIATDANGNVYVSDNDADIIAKVTPSGVLSIVAGQAGINSDPRNYLGAIDSSLFPLLNPTGVNIDSSGNLYIVDAVGVFKITY